MDWCMSFIEEFINFYFELEYRKHHTIKRDAKQWFGDAIVSRKETNNPILDKMHTRAPNLKSSVGVGSFDPHRRSSLSPDNRHSGS